MVVSVDEETVTELLEIEEPGVGLELKVEDSVVTVEETDVAVSAVEDGEDSVEDGVDDSVEDGVEDVEGVEGVEDFEVVEDSVEDGVEGVEDGVEGVEGFVVVVSVFGNVRSITV